MSTAQKVFRSHTVDAWPPISFPVTLIRGDGEEKTISYEAFGSAPATALLMVGRMMRVTNDGKEQVDVSQLGGWFDDALLPESAKAWRAMLADKEWNIDGELVGEVFMWLQEQWNERPTLPSPGSSGTQSGNGAGSTANAGSTASTSLA